MFDIIERCRYHSGFGPFFHYFAHLWHLQCKPARGKDSLIADIAALETLATGVSMIDDQPSSFSTDYSNL